MPKSLTMLLAATIATLTAVPALAQSEFPSRTVKIIVPFPPGATVDTLPRIVAEKLSARWNQPVVIENRPGAAGNIGAEAVARAEPDGYTLLSSPPPPLAINQALYPKLAFDPKAFVPITILAEVANVLVVRKGLAPTLKVLIEKAAASPDKLTYASAGNGSTTHLTMEWLKILGNIHIVHVPYRGSAPALTDLLGGQVDMMFDNLGNTLQYIQDGKIEAVAFGSAQRLNALPDVPTLSEFFPGAVSVTWFGVVAPPNTPIALAVKISEAIRATIRQPDVAQRFDALSAVPGGQDPQATAEFIKSESERWQKVIAAAGVKAE
ncbi:MAG: Bug family tripartite tricarboxylate transporter substrate binding protein [Xanthobacteraceae bacterium]